MTTERGSYGPLSTFSGRLASQQAGELSAFVELIQAHNVRSYIEIGARHGDTFHHVMSRLPAGSVGVCIDLPNGPWGGNSKASLMAACDDLRAMGYEIHCYLGDSGKMAAQSLSHGPFDAALIDGDHRYDGVKGDWLTYGPHAGIVAFHDIDGDGIDCGGMMIDVPRLWRELKDCYNHREFIDCQDGRRMGIGVIIQ